MLYDQQYSLFYLFGFFHQSFTLCALLIKVGKVWEDLFLG